MVNAIFLMNGDTQPLTRYGSIPMGMKPFWVRWPSQPGKWRSTTILHLNCCGGYIPVISNIETAADAKDGLIVTLACFIISKR